MGPPWAYGDGPVGKLFARELTLTPMEKPDVVSGDGNPVLGLRQRQGDPWGSLVTQAESMGRAQCQLVQKIRQRVTDDNADLWPPHVCARICTPTTHNFHLTGPIVF